jgi:hypothetical protein
MKRLICYILVCLIGLNFYSAFTTDAKGSYENVLNLGLTTSEFNLEEIGLDCWIDPYFFPGARVLFCNHPNPCCYFNDRTAAYAVSKCKFSEDDEALKTMEDGGALIKDCPSEPN